VIYRYVIHLEDGESHRTVRWTFAHPVAEDEVIELPTFGRWHVTQALLDERPGAGVLYCEPG
jgi:hypothetical protein